MNKHMRMPNEATRTIVEILAMAVNAEVSGRWALDEPGLKPDTIVLSFSLPGGSAFITADMIVKAAAENDMALSLVFPGAKP